MFWEATLNHVAFANEVRSRKIVQFPPEGGGHDLDVEGRHSRLRMSIRKAPKAKVRQCSKEWIRNLKIGCVFRTENFRP